MPRGGARPGAGRPRVIQAPTEKPAKAKPAATGKAPAKGAAKAAPRAKVIPKQASAHDFLLAVMNDTSQPLAERMRCALAVHAKETPGFHKPEEPGKKATKQAKAVEVAAGGSFAPRQPPSLVRSG